METISDLKATTGLSYHIDALERAARAGHLDGAHVLEIGGTLPAEVVLGHYAVAAWTAVDDISSYAAVTGVRTAELTALGQESRPAEVGRYVAYDGDASALPSGLRSGSFDVVLSLATFEHVADLPSLLEHARAALKPGGVLLAQVGPVWSGWRGHHVFPAYFAPDREKTADMLDRMIPWQHRVMKPIDMCAWLRERYGGDFAEVVTSSIYESPRINRMEFEEYERLFREACFRTEQLEVNGAPAPSSWRQALEPLLRTQYPLNRRFDIDCFWVALRSPRGPGEGRRES